MGTTTRFGWLGVVVGTIVSVPVLSCNGGSPAAAGGADTLYIGVAASRTTLTEAYFNGVALAIERLNEGREGGRPPFGLRYPPEEQPSQVAVAAGFRDDPSLIGVVGHTGSAQTLEAAPIYGDVDGNERNAVVAVSPTATNPLVTRVTDWVFRVCPTDLDAARALALFAADSMGARGAAIIYRNDLFGRGYTRTFRTAFEEAGGRVLERDPYLAGITEFDAYAGRVARRDRADLLVIAGGATDAPEIIRSFRAAGAPLPVAGSDDLAGLASDPETASEFRGVRYTAFFLASRAASPEAEGFVDAYRARYGVMPDHRAALSYDAARLIGTAAIEVGADREAIRDWIARVGSELEPFPGVTGPIAFNEVGDPIDKQVVIGEVRP